MNKLCFILSSFFLGFILAIVILPDIAQAARGGGGRGASISGDHAFSLGASIIGTDQKDLNTAISTANTSANGPISSKSLSSAYEFFAQYVFRFSGSIFSLVLRPSYFTQSSTGSGTDGAYEYKLTGYTVFPMIRFYPLESPFMKFFLQVGVGWGQIKADITTGTGNTLAFDGSSFGGITGLGVDFCFTGNHCLTVEGDVRYLPIERSVASSATGTIVGIDNPISKGREVETNSMDLSTTLSGIQGILGYTYNF